MNRRRLLSISTCALIFLFPLVGQAQRGGGGHAMGGGGHVGAGRVAAGPMRTGVVPTRSFASGRVVPARVGMSRLRTGVVTSRSVRTVRSHGLIITGSGFRFGHFPFHHRFFFNNCFGAFPCNPFFLNSAFGFPFLGAPFLGAPFFDPFLADSYAQSQPEQQPVATEDNGADTQLAVEMQRLSDEVEELRDQRAAQPVITRVEPQGSISAQPPAASTTFVFRDGHRVVTENFAIVGNTLWVLNQHTAKKVSLADLDRDATEQANSANGVEFRLP